MTIKMEPWMLRDLAGLWDMPAEPRKKFSDQLREEAARREAAEARRAQRLNDPMPALEDLVKRQGPDSAAADMLYVLFTGFARGHAPGDIVPVGFTLVDVHEFVRSERLTRERYNELRAKLLDGGAK